MSLYKSESRLKMETDENFFIFFSLFISATNAPFSGRDTSHHIESPLEAVLRSKQLSLLTSIIITVLFHSVDYLDNHVLVLFVNLLKNRN